MSHLPSLARASRSARALRRRTVGLGAVAAVAAFLAPALTAATPVGAAAARPWMNASLSAAQRAQAVLAQMTLEEKVDLMTGNQGEAPYAYYNAPIVRLGIPALKMADASGGVAPRGWTLDGTGGNATAFPSPQALGATWNKSLVSTYAAAVAGEVLNTGQNVLLGPDADIVRTPYWGRINETESEDPILNGELTGIYTKAVQKQHVIATLKHYTGYNQETNRGTGQNSVIDTRTLREVYSLAFEAVVKQADVGAVMCSFNKINGVYSCENPMTLRTILKGRIGFTGFVLTDFGAVHDTIGAITGGTDMETGTTTIYDGALLAAAQSSPTVADEVDQASLRILTTMFRIGLFDRSYTVSPLPVAKHDALARETEEQAITLLANRDHALPLTPATKSIAVIGADADYITSPNGAPWVSPTESTTTLAGIRARAAQAGASVTYAPGNDPVNAANMLETPGYTAVPSSVLSPANGSGSGLDTSYWNNDDFQGSPFEQRVEPEVKYDTGFLSTFGPWAGKVSQYPPPPTGSASAVYNGHLTVPATGAYTFSLTGFGDATLTIDGTTILTMAGANQTRSLADSAAISLTTGTVHTLQVTYRADHPYDSLEFGTLLLQWKTPKSAESPSIAQAAQVAASSDVAIVYARTFEGEQRDRVSLHLPENQDELIRAVAKANPHTIVVLATAGPVTMPWLGSVDAVVQTYIGGQEQGSALARVLWGDVNPSGKLTVTYPRSESALPPNTVNPWATATSLDVVYSDRLAVGYKNYDEHHVAPLFPFGYGLSYTQFRYGQLSVARNASSPTSPIQVTFRITNTGSRAGAEAAQVYLGLPTRVGEPPKRLVGFTKVTVAAHSSVLASVTIQPTDGTHPLDWFDTGADRWRTPSGTYRVYVGGNERATPLTASFAVADGT